MNKLTSQRKALALENIPTICSSRLKIDLRHRLAVRVWILMNPFLHKMRWMIMRRVEKFKQTISQKKLAMKLRNSNCKLFLQKKIVKSSLIIAALWDPLCRVWMNSIRKRLMKKIKNLKELIQLRVLPLPKNKKLKNLTRKLSKRLDHVQKR